MKIFIPANPSAIKLEVTVILLKLNEFWLRDFSAEIIKFILNPPRNATSSDSFSFHFNRELTIRFEK